MIRKVYLDFIWQKLRRMHIGWLIRYAWHYVLIHISYRIGRPLCGPVLATVALTYNCNCSCRMCDIPERENVLRQKGLRELSFEEMAQMLRDLKKLGVAGIGFTGGEPLLRTDVFDMLRYAKKLGFITHLNTNGFLLDDACAEKLVASGLDSLNISLDGAHARTHDMIRGCPGAFERVITAVKAVQDARARQHASVRVKVVTVLNKHNIDEVKEIVQLANELRTDCIEFIPEQLFSSEATQDAQRCDDSFIARIRDVAAYLRAEKKHGTRVENSPRHLALFEDAFRYNPSPVRCYAGYNSIALDHYGEVYPCMSWLSCGKSVGNVRETSVRAFWYSPAYTKMRKDISRCRDCYLNCQTELNLLFTGIT